MRGEVAQLGERRVRNAEVVGSNPIFSTSIFGCKEATSSSQDLGELARGPFFLLSKRGASPLFHV